MEQHSKKYVPFGGAASLTATPSGAEIETCAEDTSTEREGPSRNL
jgi:hypothetical protein